MPVVEGGTPEGVEIKIRRKNMEHTNSSQRSPASGNMGPNRHRGETRKDVKEAQQKATRDNMKVLVLVGGRRRTWMRYADLP